MSDPNLNPQPLPPASSGLSDNAAGALAYVTIIPAIVFLMLEPYNRSSYVRFHAWQSIFFCIVWLVVNAVVGMIPFLGLILVPLVMLGFLAVWVLLLLKASKGERYKLPILGDFAEKQISV